MKLTINSTYFKNLFREIKHTVIEIFVMICIILSLPIIIILLKMDEKFEGEEEDYYT